MVRDYLTHLAVRQRVSASTQNQAFCAILFLCREVLGLNVESVSPGVKAKRGERLPVVLSMPETVALLGAMSGTPRLGATASHLGRVGVLLGRCRRAPGFPGTTIARRQKIAEISSSVGGRQADGVSETRPVAKSTGRDTRRRNRIPRLVRVTTNAASSVKRWRRAKSTYPRSMR